MLQFLALLADHPVSYLACIAVSFCSVLFLFRRYFFSFIDPLFFFLAVNESMCITDVFFMWYYGMATPHVALNYAMTETALFLGVLQFRAPGLRNPPPPASTAATNALRVLYWVALPLFVGLNLLIYVERGIPLLQETRLVIYRGSGWGSLDRAFDVLSVVIIYYLIDVLRRRRWRFAEWLSLVTVVLIELMSGAKIAVLEIFFVAGLASYYLGTAGQLFSIRSKYFRAGAVLASCSAIIVIAIQGRNGTESGPESNPIVALGLRLVSCGDAFIYAYPNNFVLHIDGSHPVKALLAEYLAFFRIVDARDLPVHIGVQLSEYFTGHGEEFQTNAKHNLFGLVYFGYWGSILYSYLVGTVIGLVRCVLLRARRRNWSAGIVFVLLSLGTIQLVSEPDVLNRYAIDIALVFLPLAGLATGITFAVRQGASLSTTPRAASRDQPA